MTEKAIDETFNALFALTDLRGIFRESAPTFEITKERKEVIEEIIKKVKTSLKIIEQELLK